MGFLSTLIAHSSGWRLYLATLSRRRDTTILMRIQDTISIGVKVVYEGCELQVGQSLSIVGHVSCQYVHTCAHKYV